MLSNASFIIVFNLVSLSSDEIVLSSNSESTIDIKASASLIFTPPDKYLDNSFSVSSQFDNKSEVLDCIVNGMF